VERYNQALRGILRIDGGTSIYHNGLTILSSHNILFVYHSTISRHQSAQGVTGLYQQFIVSLISSLIQTS
jgi:hypothetical protein